MPRNPGTPLACSLRSDWHTTRAQEQALVIYAAGGLLQGLRNQGEEPMQTYKIFLAIIFYLPMVNAQDSTAASPIGYETVEQAFKALQADPAAGMQEYEGWTMFSQKANGVYILWSFTPEFHPANPSVVRREIAKINGQVNIRMDALCHSAREYCDQLIEEFRQINERIKRDQSAGS